MFIQCRGKVILIPKNIIHFKRVCVYPENTSEMLANMTASTTLEEIYPAIAIATLMRIIRDPSLSQHHTMVVQAITFIFKSLGIKCVPYIQQVIPAYLAVIRSADQTFREVSSYARSCQVYSNEDLCYEVGVVITGA